MVPEIAGTFLRSVSIAALGCFTETSPTNRHSIRHSSNYSHMLTWWSFHASNEVPSLCMHRLWRSILVFHPPFGWCFHQRWEGLHQRWEEPILSILQCRRRQLQRWETGLQQDERTILRKAMRGTEVLPCITIQWQLYCRTIVDFGIAWHHVQRFISFHIVSKFRNYLQSWRKKNRCTWPPCLPEKGRSKDEKATRRGLVSTPGNLKNRDTCTYMYKIQTYVHKWSLGSSHRTMIHFGLANQSLPLGGRAHRIRDAGIRWNMMEYVTWKR